MCVKAVSLRLVACWKIGEITTFDIGETDEKYVWFDSGKSVSIRCGDIYRSGDIRM